MPPNARAVSHQFPAIRRYLKKSMECTAELGAEFCVMHPDNDKGPEENAEMYFELLPFAKQHGVKIATENMRNWSADENFIPSFATCATADSFCDHLNAVNNDFFVDCLDVGHSELPGCKPSTVDRIHRIGPKPQALHVHDNDRIHDSHPIPFSMNIDFAPIVKALKDISYDGYMSLEAVSYGKPFGAERLEKGMKNMAVSARRLADM